MKGKYTNAAERRRHLEDLTSRTEAAERKAAALEAELRDLRATSERQIGDLRSRLAELKQQRDAVMSPELDASQRRIGELREQLEARDYEIRGLKEAVDAIKSNVMKRFRSAGFDESEIAAIVKQVGVQGLMAEYGEAIGRGHIRGEEIPADMARVAKWVNTCWHK